VTDGLGDGSTTGLSHLAGLLGVGLRRGRDRVSRTVAGSKQFLDCVGGGARAAGMAERFGDSLRSGAHPDRGAHSAA
jgi:hypothetical protein